MRGRPWQPTDRTGGAIDEVFVNLRQHIPHLLIDRLAVAHPGDDDNVYLLGVASQHDLVQVDTAPHGQPPFIIEAGKRIIADDPVHAAMTTRSWLTQLIAKKDSWIRTAARRVHCGSQPVHAATDLHGADRRVATSRPGRRRTRDRRFLRSRVGGLRDDRCMKLADVPLSDLSGMQLGDLAGRATLYRHLAAPAA